MYTTFKATVRQGKIELLDNFTLPENITLLVTVLDDPFFEQLTLSEHLHRGLNDVLRNRITVVRSEDELKNHLRFHLRPGLMRYQYVFTDWFNR